MLTSTIRKSQQSTVSDPASSSPLLTRRSVTDQDQFQPPKEPLASEKPERSESKPSTIEPDQPPQIVPDTSHETGKTNTSTKTKTKTKGSNAFTRFLNRPITLDLNKSFDNYIGGSLTGKKASNTATNGPSKEKEKETNVEITTDMSKQVTKVKKKSEKKKTELLKIAPASLIIADGASENVNDKSSSSVSFSVSPKSARTLSPLSRTKVVKQQSH